MSVKDIMTTNVVTTRPDDLLGTAAQVMLWSGGRHLPVIEDGKLVGLLSEGDLFRARSASDSDRRLLVREAMTRPVKTARPDDAVATVAARMTADKLGCLPVLDDGKLVGIVTRTDILNAIESEELTRKQSAYQNELGVEVLSFRTLRDRARLKAHLGRMDVREAWSDLQSDIVQAERLIATAANSAARFLRNVRQRAEKMFGKTAKPLAKNSPRSSRSRSGAKTRSRRSGRK